MNDPNATSTPSDSIPANHPAADSAPQNPDDDVAGHTDLAPSPQAITMEPAAPPQRLLARGIALSLLVIPLGAAAWVVLWNMDFIASKFPSASRLVQWLCTVSVPDTL